MKHGDAGLIPLSLKCGYVDGQVAGRAQGVGMVGPQHTPLAFQSVAVQVTGGRVVSHGAQVDGQGPPRRHRHHPGRRPVGQPRAGRHRISRRRLVRAYPAEDPGDRFPGDLQPGQPLPGPRQPLFQPREFTAQFIHLAVGCRLTPLQFPGQRSHRASPRSYPKQ